MCDVLHDCVTALASTDEGLREQPFSGAEGCYKGLFAGDEVPGPIVMRPNQPAWHRVHRESDNNCLPPQNAHVLERAVSAKRAGGYRCNRGTASCSCLHQPVPQAPFSRFPSSGQTLKALWKRGLWVMDPAEMVGNPLPIEPDRRRSGSRG